jgi:hypothetical protein
VRGRRVAVWEGAFNLERGVNVDQRRASENLPQDLDRVVK